MSITFASLMVITPCACSFWSSKFLPESLVGLARPNRRHYLHNLIDHGEVL